MMKSKNKPDLPDGHGATRENLGMSIDDARVHYNTDHTPQLDAFKYIQESNIKVAPGPEQHLPHEPGHVVQQCQGRIVRTKIRTAAERQAREKE